MSKKWEGFDTAMDISLSRFIEVKPENEARLRIIAKNYGYDYKGFVGNKLLLLNKKTNDKFSPEIGDYIRAQHENAAGDLKKVSAEEFKAGWDLFLSNFEIERRLKVLEDDLGI